MAEVTKAKRSRKYWLGCNWKCNGSIDFIKDSVANLFNDVQYNSEHLDFMILPGMLHLPLVQAILKDSIQVGA